MNKIVKDRNFVAKHARNMPGAGAHEIKKGHKKQKRSKSKEDFRKEVRDQDY